jgi:glutathionylspermidine synthase
MRRLTIDERPDWQAIAREFGFTFHHNGGQKYWNESAAYAFTLAQIEEDIEGPTAELHAMCLDLVAEAVTSEAIMDRLAIPREHRDLVANSWRAGERSLYGRFDLAYDGKGPAQMLEYNADTPTSIYETAFFQWQWLEDMIVAGRLPEETDQYNSLHEALVERFRTLFPPGSVMHFASVADHVEDRQTVRYLEDVARQAGLDPAFVAIDAIGIDVDGRFVDHDNVIIDRIFKLYPWEDMLREEFGAKIAASRTQFVEPAWKAILSNKGILPLLWKQHRGHPNLLPAAFDDDDHGKAMVGPNFVRKPIFSREGWDIELVEGKARTAPYEGGYGSEGHIVQRYRPLPVFDGEHAVIGSWIVGDAAVAMSIREDSGPITRDLARFVPHVILEEGETIEMATGS